MPPTHHSNTPFLLLAFLDSLFRLFMSLLRARPPFPDDRPPDFSTSFSHVKSAVDTLAIQRRNQASKIKKMPSSDSTIAGTDTVLPYPLRAETGWWPNAWPLSSSLALTISTMYSATVTVIMPSLRDKTTGESSQLRYGRLSATLFGMNLPT